MEGDDGEDVIYEGGFVDFAGFDDDGVEGADGDDVEAEDFVFGVEGDDAELLHCFTVEVKQPLDGVVAGQRAVDLAVFEFEPFGGDADLFEGVEVDGG